MSTVKALRTDGGKHPRLPIVALSELMVEKVRPREVIVPDWLRVQSSTLIYAPRGLGKTWFTLSLALMLSEGYKFADWVPKRLCRVLFLDGELDKADFQNRVRRLVGTDHDFSDRLLQYNLELEPGVVPDLMQESWWDALQVEVLDQKIDFIMADNLSALSSGDDSDPILAKLCNNRILRLRSLGVGFIMVHHMNAAGTGQRGSSVREDGTETQIKLSAIRDHDSAEGCAVLVEFTKHRHFSPEDPFELHLSVSGRHGDPWRRIDNSIVRQIREMLDGGMSQKDIGEELGISQQAVSKHCLKHGLRK